MMPMFGSACVPQTQSIAVCCVTLKSPTGNEIQSEQYHMFVKSLLAVHTAEREKPIQPASGGRSLQSSFVQIYIFLSHTQASMRTDEPCRVKRYQTERKEVAVVLKFKTNGKRWNVLERHQTEQVLSSKPSEGRGGNDGSVPCEADDCWGHSQKVTGGNHVAQATE